MTISLKDVMPLERLDEYKVHFARWNNDAQPLEVFVLDRGEWQGWQEYWPSRNDFNRGYIFSLIQFYHEIDSWLFGGIFRVIAFHKDRYEVELTNAGHSTSCYWFCSTAQHWSPRQIWEAPFQAVAARLAVPHRA